MNDRLRPVAFFILALAVALSGWWLADGLRHFRTGDRYVTVKGLAEREVPADLAVWPITFAQTGNDLPLLYQQIRGNAEGVARFLKGLGLDTAEQSLSMPRIQDLDMERPDGRAPTRYRAEVTYTVRSHDVPAVRKAIDASGELVKAGIALAPWGPPPQFSYTKLNELKPHLLAVATENARRAAEQFASDSGSRVGRIRTANQGQITIADRDAGTPEIKIVRVVTTVEYELLDD